MTTYCDVNTCEDCPRYGDDCDGDKRIEPTDLIKREDAVKTVIRKCSPICAWQVGTQQYPDCVVAEINALPSADTEWIPREHFDVLKKNYDMLAGLLVDAKARAIGAWIPCSEKLPNEDECGWYLVTVKGHELFVDVAPFNYELWEGLASHQEVIAWMPLPKPYREDGDA